MRVLFITQEDPFYIAEFFRTFFADERARANNIEFVGAHILQTLGEKDISGLISKMYGLYGATGLIRLIARYGMRKIYARTFDTLKRGEPVSVAQILKAAGVRAWQTTDINAPEVLDGIRALKPSLVLSISATQRFGPELLTIPERGCFNSHSGALPRFAGMMPTFWTLYENEPAATVTLHKMAERIDAGQIWRQDSIPIGPEDSLDDVIRATKRLSARMTWDLIEGLRAGEVPLLPNDSSVRSYYRFPTARHSAELRRRGRRLL